VKGPYPTTYGTREEVGSEKGRGEQTDQVLGSGGKDHLGIRLPGAHIYNTHSRGRVGLETTK